MSASARYAIAHGRAGDHVAIRTSFWHAFSASPMHASYHLIRGGDMRMGIAMLFKRVPSPDDSRGDH